MNYKKCPLCGCSLDFGEKCDCEKGFQPRQRERVPPRIATMSQSHECIDAFSEKTAKS